MNHLAALGFRSHSGWAAVVAVTGSPERPVVLERIRIVISDQRIPAAKQPYHAAERMDLARADAWIGDCRNRASLLALAAVRDLTDGLSRAGYHPVRAGILCASGRLLPDLPAILKSHALIHTAEGEFYREVLVRAAEQCSLPVRRIGERGAWDVAAPLFGMPSGDLRERIGNLGRMVGPPWRQDEKLASLAAWIALAA